MYDTKKNPIFSLQKLGSPKYQNQKYTIKYVIVDVKSDFKST